MNSHTIWMTASATIGFSLFVIIRFTKLLKNPKPVAVLQVLANAFVIISWGSAFLDWRGLYKLLAFGGIVVPATLATLTIMQVFWKTKVKSAD